MKNIVCPVSTDRIPEHLPRITALFVIFTLVVYVLTGFASVLGFLLVDFFLRGVGQSKWSPLYQLAKLISALANISSKPIDKAPKLFAARLGTIFIAMAIVLHLLNAYTVAITIVSMVALFATLECVVNFCLGCYVYSFLIFPIFSKSN